MNVLCKIALIYMYAFGCFTGNCSDANDGSAALFTAVRRQNINRTSSMVNEHRLY